MTLPASVTTVDRVHDSMSDGQIEHLLIAEHARELAALDERVGKLEGKVKKLKADTSLRDAERDLARAKQERERLAKKGPTTVAEAAKLHDAAVARGEENG